MEVKYIEVIKQYRSDFSELSDKDVETKYEDHRTNMLVAALQIIENDSYLKNNESLQSQCLKEISGLVVVSFLGNYSNNKTAAMAVGIIDDYEKKAIELFLDEAHKHITLDTNPKKILPLVNELNFKQKHLASKIKNIQVEPITEFTVNRFNEFFTYCKEYLKDKIDYPTPVTVQLEVSIPLLSLPKIALIHALNQTEITKGNSDSISKSYGHKGGSGLYNTYLKYNTPTRRTLPPPNHTHSTLIKKIELFKSVEPYIEDEYKPRLNREIVALEAHLTL